MVGFKWRRNSTTAILSTLLSILTVWVIPGCSSELPKDYDPEFDRRKDHIISYYTEVEPAPSYGVITAKLVQGKDVEQSLAYLDTLFSRPTGDMFWMYSSLAMYLYTKDVLPPAYRQRYRDLWRTYTPYRGDTENHWVMYYATLYLAAEEWPNEPGTAWYTGKPSADNRAEAEEWLYRWMEITTTIGQGEFDSPHYMSFFLTPMIMVYEFARDRTMKQKAGMMVDYLLADFAAEYLVGNYCGAHSRDMPNDVTDPQRAAMRSWGWLYFGDTDFMPRGETLIAALSSYRMPEVIYHIATERDTPYVHRERKRVRNVIRFGDELNPPVYKYTYMTKNYALGSMQGGILQPVQQHTWDLTFVSDTTHNTLFTIHPYYSYYELGMFFPEPLQIVYDGVQRVRPVYADPEKWNGPSPYVRTMQHENAIIVIFDIEQGVNHQHINGFFPKTLKERTVHESGWIFCRGGNTYIAYHPLKPYVWKERQTHWLLQSTDLRNGLVMEVASVEEYDSFDSFQKAILANRLDTSSFDANAEITYTTSAGDTLRFRYDGDRVLNGESIDLTDFPLYGSRFLQADVGSQYLRMTAGGIERELDFKRGRVRERRLR
jgi:hypothetical protein